MSRRREIGFLLVGMGILLSAVLFHLVENRQHAWIVLSGGLLGTAVLVIYHAWLADRAERSGRSLAGQRDEMDRLRADLERKTSEHLQLARIQGEQQARLQIVQGVASEVTEGLPQEQILKRIVERLGSHFKDFRAAYSAVDDRSVMTVLHSVEPVGMPRMEGLVLDLTAAPDYLVALRQRRPMVVPDVSMEPRMTALAGALATGGTRAVLCAPLQHSGRLVGILCLNSPEPHAWTVHEVQTLGEVADLLSLALKESWVEEERRRSEACLHLLYQTTSAPYLSAEDTIVRLLKMGVQQFGLETGILSRIEGERYEIVHAVSSEPGICAGAVLDLDRTFCRETLLASGPLFFEHAAATVWKSHPACMQGRVDAYLGTPVLVNGRVFGTLCFWSGTPRRTPFANADREFLLLMSQWIGGQIERERMAKDLRHQSTHDPLTGLMNRRLCRERLNQALARARRDERMAAVMFLDLDGFKLINDTLGHETGDALLQVVARRLTNWLREADTVARMGGDEFMVILPDLSKSQEAAIVAQKVLDAFAQPFQLETRDVQVTPSIGVTVFPADGTDPDTLIKNADTALYRAKEQGRNAFQFYTSDMNVQALERLEISNGLRRALERDELLLHYQPQVDLASGSVVGMEALVRWRHPQLGLISPTQFIPIAEETGLILPIGEWVMRRSCAQARAWQDKGFPGIRVGVNLSVRQLRQQDLPAVVERVLRETGLAPPFLELELTEGSIMNNPGGAIATLRTLHQMGVRIAIDDFGTGYSSLSHLKRFPISTLKIDQSFIRDVVVDPDDASLVQAIIAMAHSLRLTAVAEGVETAEQLAFLREHACDLVQGFHIGRPKTAEEIEPQLSRA